MRYSFTMSMENSVAHDDRVAFLLEESDNVVGSQAPENTHPYEDAAAYGSVGARLDGSERKLCDPLRAIATESITLRQHLDDAYAVRLNSIAQAALRADRMTRDLLDFVRWMMDGIQLTRRRVNLNVLCERVVDTIRDLHSDRAMMLIADDPVEAICDPDAVAAMLSRLVLNALHHGGLRAAVRIILRAHDDNVSLNVWNTGPRIDRRVRADLFEPFACGPSQSHGVEGLGLGLYLAREIARAHQGSIDVESTDRGGTTFRVTLPRF
jgi:signal transduction histidine kinase